MRWLGSLRRGTLIPGSVRSCFEASTTAPSGRRRGDSGQGGGGLTRDGGVSASGPGMNLRRRPTESPTTTYGWGIRRPLLPRHTARGRVAKRPFADGKSYGATINLAGLHGAPGSRDFPESNSFGRTSHQPGVSSGNDSCSPHSRVPTSRRFRRLERLRAPQQQTAKHTCLNHASARFLVAELGESCHALGALAFSS